MSDVQRRVMVFLSRLAQKLPRRAAVVCVTHLEVIRAAALATSGRSLDRWFEIDVPPAEALVLDLNRPLILDLNHPWMAAVC